MARSKRQRPRLVLQSLETRLAPAVRVWTGLGANDLWSNAANWDTGVPVDGDDVRIAATAESAEVLFDTSVAGSGVSIIKLTSDGANPIGEPFRITGDTLTLSGAGPFAFGDTLALAGGAIAGAADVTLGGAFTWSSGTINGSGTVNVNGGLAINNSTVKLDGRTMNLNSDTTWTAGALQLANGAVLNNQQGRTFTIVGDLSLQDVTNDSVEVFNNFGTVRKTAGTGNAIFQPRFVVDGAGTNEGVVDIQTGTLILSTRNVGFSGATLTEGTVQGAGTLNIAGGGSNVYSFDAATTLPVANLTFASGVANISGATTLGNVAVSGGTLNLNNPSGYTLANLTITAGTLSGAGAVTVTGPMTWSQGTIADSDPGSLVAFNVNGGLAINDSTVALSGRTMNLNSDTTWTAGALQLANGAVLNNQQGRTFTIVGDRFLDDVSGDAGVGEQFVNNGIVQKTSGSDTGAIEAQFTNNGTIRADSGRLSLTGTFTNYNAAAQTLTGGTYFVSASFSANAFVLGTNAATIVLDGAASQFLNNAGNGNALAAFAANTSAGSFTIQNGRNFSAAGAFTNAGNMIIGSGSTFERSTGNYTQTAGTTNLDGTLKAANVDIQGGTLQRAASPGLMTINGNYTQANAGNLLTAIGGLTAGTEFDQLVVSGAATLDGTVTATILGGFAPAVSDTFRIVNAGARNGTFATANGLFPGGRFVPIYDATGVVLDANLSPTPASDGDATLEDQEVTTIVLVNDSDPDGDALTIVAVGNSANGASPVNNGDGTITYTPPANFVGSDSFTYTVRDTAGNETTATVTIDVSPVNDTPTLDEIVDQSILEDAGLHTVDLTGIFSGPINESQNLTVAAFSDNPGLIANPAVNYTSPNTTGALSFTPTANQSGTATITVIVTDDGGTANGGVNEFIRTFTVTVTPVNDVPTLDPISDPPPLNSAAPQTINLTGISAGTNESQTLTVTAVSSNHNLIPDPSIDYTSPNSTGTLTFTPIPNRVGQAIITVTITDSGGTDNDGVNSFSRTFTITAINDAPTLDAIGDVTILEDPGLQSINLTGITAGPEEEQTLTVTTTSSNPGLIPNPTVDYTSPNATGILRFAPSLNQHGSAVITVKVKDDGGTALGGVDEVTRTFVVTVAPVPDAPTIDTTPIPMLPALALKPAPTNPAGMAINVLLEDVTEVDGEPLGIAITAIDNLKGKWQYSLDGGTNWISVPVDVSSTAALVLVDQAATRVHFLPNKGFQGFSSFFYKAWDQSDGELNEARVDTTLEPTAYSSASERAWVAVGKSNPVVNGNGVTVLAAVKEDSKSSRTFTVKNLLGIAGLEQAPATNLGMAITSASTASGKWQFKLAKTTTFVDVGVVSDASALLLRPIDTLRFVPNANADGQADLTLKTWDQVGAPGAKVDTAAVGFGKDPGFATIDITAVNDAPVLDLSVPAALDPVDPGQTTNEPTFASLMSATDVEGATPGVAIVAVKCLGWEFKPVGGVFTPLGVVSSGKALLLDAGATIRFVAPSGIAPGTATLSFKAWDKSVGVAGTRVPVRGTAFSKQTEIATVAIGNEAPLLDTTPDVTMPNGVVVVKSLLGSAVTDVVGSPKGIAITFVDNTNGKWQYSLGGNVFIDIGTVNSDAALLLTDGNKLRFVPNAGFTGPATIQYRAWDRTTGQAGDRIDTDSGLNSFSLEVETATLDVL